MATWPAKTNYATGDVLTAANMNTIGDELNELYNRVPGDITGVTAGTGLTGGGTSGDVTVSFDVANYGGGQYAAGKNKIINGDFGINQRNFTSTTTNDTYGFDRWKVGLVGGTVTYSAQTFTPGTAPVTGYEGTNYARILTSGQSAVGDLSLLQQLVEDVRTFANQTVVVSFWAKAASGTPKIGIELEQAFGTGGSSSVFTALGAVTVSTSWTRYSISVAAPSISGKTIGTSSRLSLNLWTSAGSNWNTRASSIGLQNNTIDFWGVQLEAGSTATPFQTATGTKQGELAACQRYYRRWDFSQYTGSASTIGIFDTNSELAISFNYPTMRTSPSIATNINTIATSITATSSILAYSGSAISGTFSATQGRSTANYLWLAVTGWSGTNAGKGATVDFGTTSYLEASAEL